VELSLGEVVEHLLLKIFRSGPKTSQHQGLLWCKRASMPPKDLKAERQNSLLHRPTGRFSELSSPSLAASTRISRQHFHWCDTGVLLRAKCCRWQEPRPQHLREVYIPRGAARCVLELPPCQTILATERAAKEDCGAASDFHVIGVLPVVASRALSDNLSNYLQSLSVPPHCSSLYVGFILQVENNEH